MILDDDIASALRVFGATARTVRPVTGTPSVRSDRAAFRVGLTDGRVVKARRHSRVAVARRYVGLARLLRTLPLPPILARQGRVTIETWIDGTPLDERARTTGRMWGAGAILGAIHRTDGSAHGAGAADASTRPFVADLLGRLHDLTDRGALTAAQGRALGLALASRRPGRARTGLTHNDFCDENLVEDAEGRLHVVDNGGLRAGFLDFDLARAWYRWPMSDAAWHSFLAGYGRWRRVPVRAEVVRFWRIAAIVRSAHFRVVRDSRDAATPLRRLRVLAGGGRALARALTRAPR
ncbi:MAG: aminoglycoside phosphotransferase family protein [Candidatus Binatia bacterium]